MKRQLALRKKGTHRSATSTRGWSKAAPRRVLERRRIAKRCGRGAFLVYRKRKLGASVPEFPIVAKSGGCAPDCRGLWAAKQRASQTGRKSVAAKATKIAKAAGCHWARSE